MNTVSSPNSCPRCGVAIPSEAPDGLCPRCVLLGAATPTESGSPSRLGEPPPLETVQAAFPQLKIEGLIGRGGMGFVYRARQPQLDRTVALKLLPVPVGADPTFAERFAREGRLLARLNHPNIVAVFDFGQTSGFAFLLLEFVDGVNLRQAMLGGRFSAREALAIVPKICDALQFAHEHGVLHRDIKPENILLDEAGRVKIADFGIAKLVGDRHGDVTLTASGARLGTPHYMAPEQVEKPSAVDHRADIYSLGVVFYELLTGELPLGRFAAPSAKADLDSRVDAIVMRALAKERELRQQSADEVKTEVEGLGTAAPASATSQRRGQPGFEYKSARTLFGLPLLHVVRGTNPTTGRPRQARGIVAIGGKAVGGLAIGGRARGIVAFGGQAIGLFAYGGIAVGGFAVGGVALGLFSLGGLAIGLILALGGIAAGWSGFGGLVVAQHGIGEFLAMGQPLPGTGLGGALIRWLPWLWIPFLPLSLVPGLVSTWAYRKLDQPLTGVCPNPWPHRLFCLLAALVTLPASAIVAGLLAPVVARASGDLGGITAGLIPMATGVLLVWLFLRTRPTTAQAQPREQWNPWPKRLFVAVIAMVVVPVSLVLMGLLVPYVMSRFAVRPPLPAPSAAGEPRPPAVATTPIIFLRPVERIASASQVRLRWELYSNKPTSVRLSYGRQSAELPLSQRGVGDFLETVTVQFERQKDGGAAVQMTVMAGDVTQGKLFSAAMAGEPSKLLARANDLVAGDLVLQLNTPVWIAFFGDAQVVLEILSADSVSPQ